MRAWPVLVGALALCASCALNPVSGWPEFVFISAERERALGVEQEQQFLAEFGRSDHAASASWVEEIGTRLAAYSPRKDVTYRFHVVDLEEPNAFALPGGPVFVSRGLLALARSEDELAGVIGHEIGHVAARHSVGQTTAATPLALVFGVPAAIVGSVSRPLGVLVGLPGAFVSGLALSAYGREQEHEADQIGAQLAAKAGYRPLALADYLERLEREEALHHDGPPPLSFFSSHPSTPDRTRKVRAYAMQLAPGAPPISRAGEEAALERLDGLLVGASPAHGVFVEDEFLHAELGFAFRIPAHWDKENRPEALVALDPASQGRVALLLELAGDGDDPLAAARAQVSSEEQQRVLHVFEVNGRTAAQLEVGSGSAAAQLTWIALGGRIYRIAGIYPLAEGKSRRPEIARAIESLRPLTAQDRARIRGDRLRIQLVEPGDSLPALLARSRCVWSAAEVAVSNDLEPGQPLAAGVRLKVAVAESWTPNLGRRN
jgi:predicted Zn-dependent protease